MYIYGSYREIKTGLSLFWTTLYTPLQIPEHGDENAEAAEPVNRDYLIPTQTGDHLSTAQTSSPVTSTYESIGPLAPAGDGTYTRLHIPRNDYEEVP